MRWPLDRIRVLPSSTVIPKVVESIIYLWQLFEDGAVAVLDAQAAVVDLINETGIARRRTTVFNRELHDGAAFRGISRMGGHGIDLFKLAAHNIA